MSFTQCNQATNNDAEPGSPLRDTVGIFRVEVRPVLCDWAITGGDLVRAVRLTGYNIVWRINSLLEPKRQWQYYSIGRKGVTHVGAHMGTGETYRRRVPVGPGARRIFFRLKTACKTLAAVP